jgi:predicted nucleotidyltransferase
LAVATDIENKIQSFIQLASRRIKIDQVYIFGSSVTGKRHEWSDIDLVIISPDFSGDSFEDSKMLFPFILQVDRSIEVHPFHPTDFNPTNPFVREIMDTGVKII